MKVNNRLKTILLAITCSLLFACGNKDACENVVCPAAKVCSNGNCDCSTGFEGANCDSLSAIKFVGNYQINENCFNPAGPGFQYQSNISFGFNEFEVIINNILGSGLSIEAVVDKNFISIREQTVGNITIVGEGNFQPALNRIEINYQYNYGGQSRSCTAFFQKF
jgi:hypothetical protein